MKGCVILKALLAKTLWLMRREDLNTLEDIKNYDTAVTWHGLLRQAATKLRYFCSVAPSIAVDNYQVTILLLLLLCGTVCCGRQLPSYDTAVTAVTWHGLLRLAATK